MSSPDRFPYRTAAGLDYDSGNYALGSNAGNLDEPPRVSAARRPFERSWASALQELRL